MSETSLSGAGVRYPLGERLAGEGVVPPAHAAGQN